MRKSSSSRALQLPPGTVELPGRLSSDFGLSVPKAYCVITETLLNLEADGSRVVTKPRVDRSAARKHAPGSEMAQ